MPGFLGDLIRIAHNHPETRPLLLRVILGQGGKREQVADLAHQQWSGWMEYLFSKCEKNEDGSVTIPVWAVERWTRQMGTPYGELSEEEKDSDRKEADKFLGLLG